MSMKFKSREEFLAWRKSWRLAYGLLSLEIRETKQDIRGPLDNCYTASVRADDQRHLVLLRAQARTMMMARDAALMTHNPVADVRRRERAALRQAAAKAAQGLRKAERRAARERADA